MSTYSNIPTSATANQTVQAFDNYYSQPIEVDASVLAAITGYFTSKGFGQVASESIAVIIISQSKKDGYNPMRILDTLRGLNTVDLSALVSEILNYNRFKTSSLGFAQTIMPNGEVYRNIVDTQTLPKFYSVVASASTINEGDSVTFTINTVNVANGTTLYWTLAGTGITVNDFNGGETSGAVTIVDSTASVTIDTRLDSAVESNETLIFDLRKKSINGSVVASASTLINNTSFSFLADYIVIEYTFLTGRDLDTRTRIALPAIGSYSGWGFTDLVPNLLEWGGDNTGTGTEASLLKVANFRSQYPSVEDITIDCRAQWYNIVGSDPVGLKVSMYIGGTMVKDEDNYNWTNPTATSTQILDLNLKVISLFSQESEDIGERIATFKYNLVTGEGYLDPTDTTVYI
jgi:hypothetical protein